MSDLPSSDKDWFGVYLSKERGLHVAKNEGTLDGNDPDFVLYGCFFMFLWISFFGLEVAMYCKLLLKGNPKVVEPLFTCMFCFIVFF